MIPDPLIADSRIPAVVFLCHKIAPAEEEVGV